MNTFCVENARKRAAAGRKAAITVAPGFVTNLTGKFTL
jgi:hypothetical protein